MVVVVVGGGGGGSGGSGGGGGGRWRARACDSGSLQILGRTLCHRRPEIIEWSMVAKSFNTTLLWFVQYEAAVRSTPKPTKLAGKLTKVVGTKQERAKAAGWLHLGKFPLVSIETERQKGERVGG
ncbi:hypothetical protein PoB_002053700 [Plakobranchus ocellatus]|uniref:Uncharacterized protein n=1 Tax=Plakobranchus ocellatus TaxID=259542 RepID=A0AAV3ZHQ1_9GAST|nr:hypothetical protein PoB_002053700 [Plakobranchus ocellatus]